MSPSLNPLSQAIATVLVTALVTVEHDREKHIPGVTSGPNAESFLVPDHVADSLIKAGAVKRAEVVDADALSSVVDTSLLGTSTATGLVTTFADAAEMAEADKLRAQLADAVAARDNLIEQLADTQEQLAAVNEQLNVIQAERQVITGAADATAGTSAVTDVAGTTNAGAAAVGDVAAADAAAPTDAASDEPPAADTATAETAEAAAASATTTTRRRAS